MADLTAKKRASMKSKDFGLPEKARTTDQKKESGNYPMPDKAHARNAKARAEQQYEKGNLTKDELERIDRKADKKLGQAESRVWESNPRHKDYKSCSTN